VHRGRGWRDRKVRKRPILKLLDGNGAKEKRADADTETIAASNIPESNKKGGGCQKKKAARAKSEKEGYWHRLEGVPSPQNRRNGEKEKLVGRLQGFPPNK